MKFLPCLLSLVGPLYVAAASLTSLEVRGGNPDEKDGLCRYYYSAPGRSMNNGLQPCTTYFNNHGGHGFAMWGFRKHTDDDGFRYVPAPCKCDDKTVEVVAGEIAKLIVEALSQLDHILCAVFVSAIMEVAEIGLMFVPGGAAVMGAGKVIQYAKSAYENGMNAANFFTDWIGPACGVPDWDFSLDDMFRTYSWIRTQMPSICAKLTALCPSLVDMVKAPDSMMGSDLPTGCLRKNKKDCKKIDKKEDPKEGTEVHRGKNPDKKKEDEEKKRKKKEEEDKKRKDEEEKKKKDDEEKKKKKKEEEEKKKSSKIRRAPAPYVPESTRTVKKFGEDEIRTTKECVSGKNEDVVHITRTDSNIGHYIQARSDIPKNVCKSEHTQACYHYSKKNIEWQHWFPWANGYIYRERVMENGQPKIGKDDEPVWKGCERDEFPPRSGNSTFGQGMTELQITVSKPAISHITQIFTEPRDVVRQLVRLIPADQNQGAGQLWSGFCNDNNAASTTSISGSKKTIVVSANLKSVKGKETKEVTRGVTTSITTVTVSTLRAIFSIAEFPGLNSNYDGLALLTDDEWYQHEGLRHATNTADYRKSPTKAQVDAARRKIDAAGYRKVQPEERKKMWEKYVGDGDGQIPAELWGVLPSLPQFPKPKRVKRRSSLADVAAFNETLTLEDRDADDVDWDGREDDVDGMTDEELEQWLGEYEEVVRRMYVHAGEEERQEPTPTSPPVVDAEATMAVPREIEELVRGEPPAVGSEVTDRLPLPTSM
ncbi:hypothetical protein PG996_011719 [Apiospora saccharicola]|uniref:Uncharacterized protein n=1 Tax=Apiospora saccharicola TaxID=335842 RepID=A0ABR1UFU4_9PEZI